MTNKKEFIPAMGYHWLTGFYDLIARLTMPEKKFRTKFIDEIGPKNGEAFLEHGLTFECQQMEAHVNYTQPHKVMLHLKTIAPCVLENPGMYLEMHLDYYRILKENNRLLQYGMALTGNAICILLHVLSDKDFECIVSNDPALDKIYELVSAVPFTSVL